MPNDVWLPAPNTEAVESFGELYRRVFGEELSVEDAREAATRLILTYLMKREFGMPVTPEEVEAAEAAREKGPTLRPGRSSRILPRQKRARAFPPCPRNASLTRAILAPASLCSV